MNRLLALCFSVVGVLMLAGIGFSLSVGSAWLTILFIAASIGVMAYGFVLKAKLGRRS
jgi:hypothetical protein